MVLCAEWGWGDVKTIVQGLIQDRGSEGLCAHTTTLLSRRCIVIPSRRRAGSEHRSGLYSYVRAGKLLVGANPMNGWQGPLYPVRQARALL